MTGVSLSELAIWSHANSDLALLEGLVDRLHAGMIQKLFDWIGRVKLVICIRKEVQT